MKHGKYVSSVILMLVVTRLLMVMATMLHARVATKGHQLLFPRAEAEVVGKVETSKTTLLPRT